MIQAIKDRMTEMLIITDGLDMLDVIGILFLLTL